MSAAELDRFRNQYAILEFERSVKRFLPGTSRFGFPKTFNVRFHALSVELLGGAESRKKVLTGE